jgi:hypothetical protein
MSNTLKRPAVPDLIASEEDDGFEAFIAGQGRLDNPHHVGGEKHAAWERGWLEARTYHE